MNKLRIPYAKEGDFSVTPKVAIKQIKYQCPICGEDVFLKSGEIKRPHFAHYSDDCNNLTGETLEHLTAKLNLYKDLKDSIENGKKLNLKRTFKCKCSSSGYLDHTESTPFSLNLNYKVFTEYIFKIKDKYKIIDVALLKNGKPEVFFEIVQSNFLTEEKISFFGNIAWMEVKAQDILNDFKYIRPMKHGNLKKLKCDCKPYQKELNCLYQRLTKYHQPSKYEKLKNMPEISIYKLFIDSFEEPEDLKLLKNKIKELERKRLRKNTHLESLFNSPEY